MKVSVRPRIEQKRPNTRKNVVKNEKPHIVSEMYGVEYKIWLCYDSRLGMGFKFQLAKMKYKDKDEDIPGKEYMSRLDRYRDVPFHYVREDWDEGNFSASIEKRCFIYYFKRLKEKRNTTLKDIQSKIANQTQEKIDEIRRKRERERWRREEIKAACEFYGCAPEQLKNYQIRTYRNMGNEMARKSPAHR